MGGWVSSEFYPEFSRGGILGIKRFMKEGGGGDWEEEM